MNARRAVLVLLLGGAATDTAVAQVPTPPNLLERDPALVQVAPPAALTRADLARRLKKLDRSLPDALRAGNAVVVGPGRMAVGRTTLEIQYPRGVAVLHDTPVALFTEAESRAAVRIEFDAAAAAQYAIDFVAIGAFQTDPGGAFEIEVRAVGVPRPLSTHRVTAGPDGHQLFSFSSPQARRVTVHFTRASPGPAGWRFVRAELLRVR
jgi:hypothetical protein